MSSLPPLPPSPASSCGSEDSSSRRSSFSAGADDLTLRVSGIAREALRISGSGGAAASSELTLSPMREPEVLQTMKCYISTPGADLGAQVGTKVDMGRFNTVVMYACEASGIDPMLIRGFDLSVASESLTLSLEDGRQEVIDLGALLSKPTRADFTQFQKAFHELKTEVSKAIQVEGLKFVGHNKLLGKVKPLGTSAWSSNADTEALEFMKLQRFSSFQNVSELVKGLPKDPRLNGTLHFDEMVKKNHDRRISALNNLNTIIQAKQRELLEEELSEEEKLQKEQQFEQLIAIKHFMEPQGGNPPKDFGPFCDLKVTLAELAKTWVGDEPLNLEQKKQLTENLSQLFLSDKTQGVWNKFTHNLGRIFLDMKPSDGMLAKSASDFATEAVSLLFHYEEAPPGRSLRKDYLRFVHAMNKGPTEEDFSDLMIRAKKLNDPITITEELIDALHLDALKNDAQIKGLLSGVFSKLLEN